MKRLNKYTFTVLRYVHDIVTGEFANVGVVIHSPNARMLRAKVRTTYGRVSKVFPAMDGESFKSELGYIERALARADKQFDDLFGDSSGNALAFAIRVLPRDDSSFQWSPLGSGVAENLNAELDDLFSRFVLSNDERMHAKARTDEEVWRSFSRSLDKRRVLSHLEPKEIVSSTDSVVFQHAWKNGAWNCLVPLSLDVIDPQTFKEKALKSVGQAHALMGATERFKLFMLVGEPRQPGLNTHFTKALRILESMPGEHEIHLESRAEEFSDYLCREIQAHLDNGEFE
jgi:hypothetical protein